jgi:ankyrin repeat protein
MHLIGGRTLLSISFFFSFSIVSYAAAAGPDLRLLNAVAEQDKSTIRALLKERVDVNAARPDGVTALLYAAHWADLEVVDLLLRAGARVNAADDHGVTPLARGCENGSLGVVERLLSAGADANVAESSGLTPLMIAAKSGNVQLIKALLARGATVNAATGQTKETALMWAVAGQHTDVAKALIEAGADVRASSASGFTPLLIAARNGDVALATMLTAAGADVNATGSDGTHLLPFALVNGQAKFAEFLLERGADPNGAMGGIRALHAAVGAVNPWLGEWAQKHAGALSGRSLTPEERLRLVTALLDRGADPNVGTTKSAVFMDYLAYPWKGAFEPYSCGTGDLRGATPVWLAAYAANGSGAGMGRRRGTPGADRPGDATDPNVELMRVLLKGGADPRIPTADGTTALMVAAGLGRCTNDYTLQRGARSQGGEQAVTLLLDAGVEVNAINEADFTAAHGAAFRGLNEIIQILVERGANINARDYRGRTPYRLAQGSKQSFYFQGYPETTQFIEKLGGNPNLGLPGNVQERLRNAATGQQ